MSMTGMSATTGQHLSGIDHIRQSVRDILTTPIGTRIMRRDYGSELFQLIDQPQNGANRLRIMAATAMAVIRWEPRISVTGIDVISGGMDGSLTITLSGNRRDDGRQYAIEVGVT